MPVAPLRRGKLRRNEFRYRPPPPFGTAVRAPESPELLEPPPDPEPDDPAEYPPDDTPPPELPDHPAAEPLAPPLFTRGVGSG